MNEKLDIKREEFTKNINILITLRKLTVAASLSFLRQVVTLDRWSLWIGSHLR